MSKQAHDDDMIAACASADEMEKARRRAKVEAFGRLIDPGCYADPATMTESEIEEMKAEDRRRRLEWLEELQERAHT